jgi:hypothetical protein
VVGCGVRSQTARHACRRDGAEELPGNSAVTCAMAHDVRARALIQSAHEHTHSHARRCLADTRRRSAYLVGSSMRRLSTARGIDDRAGRSAYASSIAAAWPHPLTAAPTYTHSHLHPFPLTPIPTYSRTHLHPFPLTAAPTYTHSHLHPTHLHPFPLTAAPTYTHSHLHPTHLQSIPLTAPPTYSPSHLQPLPLTAHPTYSPSHLQPLPLTAHAR